MRWNEKDSKKIDSPKVDAFLADIHEVCKKHGLCIEHEDCQGGFIIEKYENARDFDWLGAACVGKTVDDP
jgi:hypothetical protein